MADAVIVRQPVVGTKWAYEWGLVLKSILEVWRETDDAKYFDFVKTNVDRFVNPDGSLNAYSMDEYNIDSINAGKLLFPLYQITGDERYRLAAQVLRNQMRAHPRTQDGGFWHKKIYPRQMWLDGIYMATPFLMEYAATFDEPATFDDGAHQIVLMESHARDPRTGLLYHGWTESVGEHPWANPETGQSPHFWGRAMGWYMMALVDSLDFLPLDHPQRGKIINILDTSLSALAAVRDPLAGVWYQVLDQGQRAGNYLESSVSCMTVYAMCKAVRCGYIDSGCADIARQAYRGILNHFVDTDEAGLPNLNRICYVAGLGGKDPYRSGTFEYYISENIVSNDFKGVGPFILAGVELDRLS
jgi:unsaturated rhamnogalacturonyl hydrolase